MNMSQIVELVYDEHPQYQRHDIRTILDSILDVLGESLENGEDVVLPGYFKLYVKQMAERIGRDPRIPGSKLTIPAYVQLRMKVSPELKERINRHGCL